MAASVSNEIKVSVSITAYNHASYISQALDSVLAQKVNFSYEILLGEDESTDGTREICIEYANRHPEIIKLFMHDRKEVLYINGKPSGRRNLYHNLVQARGEYIALLDGDDFWTCNDKLQKQVDLLDSNPGTAICFHNAQVPVGRPHLTQITDLFFGNYIPTCSAMFRNTLHGKLPEWFFETPMGDWPLYILHSEHGDIRFIDEAMGCYREHPGGVWSSTSKADQNNKTIKALNIFAAYFASNQLYSSLIRQSIDKHNTLSMNIYFKNWLNGLFSDGGGIASALRKRNVESVAIFGSKETGLCVMRDCVHAKMDVVSFIDNNTSFHSSRIDNIPINPPEFLAGDNIRIDAIVLTIEGSHEDHVRNQLRDALNGKEVAILSWKELLQEMQ